MKIGCVDAYQGTMECRAANLQILFITAFRRRPNVPVLWINNPAAKTGDYAHHFRCNRFGICHNYRFATRAGSGIRTGVCVTLGMVSGCFGGVVRDVLLNEIPLIFRQDIYASASLLGGVLFLILSSLEIFAPLATALSIIFIVAFRLAVLRFGWKLPDIR